MFYQPDKYMKTIISIFLLFFIAGACVEHTQMNIANLKCEYKVNPLGVDIHKPRFSWNLQSDQRGAKQTAYQVLIASNAKNLNDNTGDMWNSKKVSSDNSIQIYYEGKPLSTNKKYYWKVIIWSCDNTGGYYFNGRGKNIS